MLYIKFQGNQPRGYGEEDFLRFSPYMDMAAILVIRPVPYEQPINLPLAGSCRWNLIKIGQAVSKNKSIENVNEHLILVTFGQGYWMTLAFGIQTGAWNTFFRITDYHCLRKIQCFTFFHSKAQRTKFDLDQNGSRSTQGHHLNKFGSTRLPNVTWPIHKLPLFSKNAIFHLFLIQIPKAPNLMKNGSRST